MFVYVCMHACMYVCICVHSFIYVCMYRYVYVYVCMYKCILVCYRIQLCSCSGELGARGFALSTTVLLNKRSRKSEI